VSDFQLDWDREARTGTAEAVFCTGKSVEQIATLIESVFAERRRILLTRLPPERFAALPESIRKRLDYDGRSGTAIAGDMPTIDSRRRVVIVAAGTSDLPVAAEASRTLAFHGVEAPMICDVGVAGLWRLMKRVDEIRSYDVVIVVAGMEGALFGVVAGLVKVPVIAVPVSVGYGVGAGGHAALTAALASCAPGVVAVNIDNGFGAAIAAIKMLGIGRP
jgi:NCAIR mutase (PurE)-related protein